MIAADALTVEPGMTVGEVTYDEPGKPVTGLE